MAPEVFQFLIEQMQLQHNETRSEIKSELKVIHEILVTQNERIAKTEQFNWKVTAICVGVIALIEIALKIADVTIGKT